MTPTRRRPPCSHELQRLNQMIAPPLRRRRCLKHVRMFVLCWRHATHAALRMHHSTSRSALPVMSRSHWPDLQAPPLSPVLPAVHATHQVPAFGPMGRRSSDTPLQLSCPFCPPFGTSTTVQNTNSSLLPTWTEHSQHLSPNRLVRSCTRMSRSPFVEEAEGNLLPCETPSSWPPCPGGVWAFPIKPQHPTVRLGSPEPVAVQGHFCGAEQ